MIQKITINALVQIFAALVALALIRAYTEYLDPTQVGLLMLILGGVGLFDQMFSAALSQSVFYFATKEGLEGHIKKLHNPKIQRNITGISLLCVLIGLLYFSKKNTIGSFPWEIISLAPIYVISELRRSVNVTLLSTLESKKKYSQFIIAEALLNLIFIAGLLSLNPIVESALIGLTLAKTMSMLIATKLAEKSNKIAVCNEKTKNYKASIADHIKPFVIMGAVGWVSSSADKYIIGWSLNLQEAGIYAITLGLIARPYGLLTAALTLHYRPLIYASSENINSHLRSEKIIREWVVAALLIGILGAATLYVFKIPIFGILLSSGFVTQATFLVIPATMLFTIINISHVFDNYLLSKNRAKDLTIVQIASMPLMIGCVAAGAYFDGAIGAAWGRVVSEMIRLGSVIFISKNRTIK